MILYLEYKEEKLMLREEVTIVDLSVSKTIELDGFCLTDTPFRTSLYIDADRLKSLEPTIPYKLYNDVKIYKRNKTIKNILK